MTSYVSISSQNTVWVRSTTFRQLVESGVSSLFVASIQTLRCSTRIPDGPPFQFYWILFIDHSTSASGVIKSSTRKGSIYTGMFAPGGGATSGIVQPAPLSYPQFWHERGKGAGGGVFIQPLHPGPHFFHQRWFRCKKEFNNCPG